MRWLLYLALKLSFTVAFIARRPASRLSSSLRSSSNSGSGFGDVSNSESRRERQARRERIRREKYGEEGDSGGDGGLSLDSPMVSEVRSIAQQIPCPCQSGRYFGMCCQPVMEQALQPSTADASPDAATVVGPEELLRARYSAYVKENVDFVILTTHHTHPEYTVDVESWRRELVEFIRCVTFRKFEVKAYEAVDETTALVTWAARMKVLPDVLAPEKVQTKEFTERSKFLFEDGRWWYAGGDEDFEPTNELVDDKPPARPRGGGGGDKPAKKKAKAKPRAKVAARK